MSLLAAPSFVPVCDAVERTLARHALTLAAIDGQCGSGKSALAAELAARYGGQVVHMDDFFLPPDLRTQERLAQPGGNADVERFIAQVMRPLCAGQIARYQRYDCATGQRLCQPEVAPHGLVIIEGAYSLHPRLRDAYHAAIGLAVSPAAQEARIRRREGDAKWPDFASKWIPLEQRYLEETGVWARCDAVVDTSELF